MKWVKRQLERLRSDSLKLAAYAVGIFAAWTLLLLTLPYSAWLGLGLKVLVLGVPAYLVARFTPSARNLIGSLGLRQVPHAGWIALSTAVLVSYLALVGGWSGLRPISAFFVVSAVVVSPLVEEFVFRGVLLQQLDRVAPFIVANLTTTVLFVLYHIPLWSARGQAPSLMSCLWVATLSLWLGYVMRRSRSLWTCIVVHAIQNLLLGAP